MDCLMSQRNKYLFAAVLGAIGGGLIVVCVTKAIPRIMSQLMPKMMHKMMSRMGGEGWKPVDM